MKKGKILLLTIVLMIFSVAQFFAATPSVSAFALPDTNFGQCHDLNTYAAIPCSGTGQDAEYSLNPQSHVDNGNGTVTDNVTGQMWQKDAVLLNSWYETERYCKGQQLGGYTDWRVPTSREAHFYYAWDSIDLWKEGDAFFQTFTSESGITTNPTIDHADAGTYFFDGVTQSEKEKSGYIHCVRGAAIPAPAFIKNGDGTATDNTTGLTWRQKGEWVDNIPVALQHCTGNWRLPNINELFSLYIPVSNIRRQIDPTSGLTYMSSSKISVSDVVASSTLGYGYESSIDFFGYPMDGTKHINDIIPRIVFCVSGGRAGTQNNCLATISIDTSPAAISIHIPVVTYAGAKYRLDLKMDASGTMAITKISAIVSKNTDPFATCAPSTLSSDFKLHIPVLLYAGVSFWLDLQWNGTGFAVKGIDKN